jgi:hypothetical protein
VAFQAALQLDETVARIEHEQGRGNPVRQDALSDLSTARPPRRWRPLLRADAPRIQGASPTSRARRRAGRLVNIEALLIASGQNIKRLVAARERGPRKMAQAADFRPPDRVSHCRSHVSGRWPSLAGAKAYFNRLWCPYSIS